MQYTIIFVMLGNSFVIGYRRTLSSRYFELRKLFTRRITTRSPGRRGQILIENRIRPSGWLCFPAPDVCCCPLIYTVARKKPDALRRCKLAWRQKSEKCRQIKDRQKSIQLVLITATRIIRCGIIITIENASVMHADLLAVCYCPLAFLAAVGFRK